MNDELERLARELDLEAPDRRMLRLRFGHACVVRIRHFLEQPEVLACLSCLGDYLDGKATEAQRDEAAEEAARLANRHQGSVSIDGCGHAAVSATYAAANALAGKALAAAEYAAYACVYGGGGYGAVTDRSAFAHEFAWQVGTLRALAGDAGSPSLGTTAERSAVRELLEDAARRSIRYLDGLAQRSVAPRPEAVAALSRLDVPLPETSQDPAATLAELDGIVTPATVASAGGRFFGFVIGGALPVSVASNWLGTAWDQNSALHAATPGTAVVERVALGWLLDVLQLPRDCAGGFVTGATMANFTALAAARHAVLRQAGWDVEAEGLFGAPPISIILGEEAHPTLLKSLGMLGFGRRRVLRVPVDGQGRMRADALPRMDGPAIVCLQAGNINTGAFDPFDRIVRLAHDHGAWVHVDGAFGLWAAASPRHASWCQGMAQADSWATDAHKWLNVPYDNGIAFVRNGEALRAAMAITAEYLPTDGPYRNPADYTPELSRRARGTDVWAALRTLGRSGVRELVERCCAHARRLASELEEAGFEVLNEVVLNQVLVSFGDPTKTGRVISALQSEGTLWIGPTVWQSRTAARFSVSSWATTADDVTRSVKAIKAIAGCV